MNAVAKIALNIDADAAAESLGTFAFAGVLLAGAVGLLLWHVRVWQGAQRSRADSVELRYRYLQYRRRMQTSALMAFVAISLPIAVLMIRQWPRIAVGAWGMILLALMWIGLLALADIIATRQHFGRIRAGYQLEQTRLKAELQRIRTSQADGPSPPRRNERDESDEPDDSEP